MADGWQRLVHAARSLRRAWKSTLAAVIVLAASIACCTSVFSAINTMLWTALPVPASHELVFVYSADPDLKQACSHADCLQFSTNRDLFRGVAIERLERSRLMTSSGLRAVIGERVSANYFDVLGVMAIEGRTFRPEDDAPGAEPVLVINEAFWRQLARGQLGQSAVGQQLALPGADGSQLSYTIVGVVSPTFNGVNGLASPAAYWVPFLRRLADDRRTSGINIPDRFARVDVLIARMQPGVRIDEVRAFADYWARQTAIAPGQAPKDVRNSLQARLAFDSDSTHPDRLGLLVILFTLLLFVLAAANVSGILVARVASRRSEIAMQMALGATPARLSSQFALEGLLLGLLAAGIGLVISFWTAATLFRHVLAEAWFAESELALFQVDIRVFAYVSCLVLLVSLVVGLSAARAISTLGRGVTSSARQRERPWRSVRVRQAVLLPQIAVSAMLLVAGGVAVERLYRVTTVELGFQPDSAAFVQFDFPVATLTGAPSTLRIDRDSLLRRLLVSLSQSGRIEAAAIVEGDPLRPSVRSVIDSAGQRHTISTLAATPGYFESMGIPLLRGRDFLPQEGDGANRTSVIVDETVAERLWPDGDPLGQALDLPTSANTSARLTVVGVVGGVRAPLSEGASRPTVYFPLGARSMADTIVFKSKRPSDRRDTAAFLVGEASRLSSNLEVLGTGSYRSEVERMRAPRSTLAMLLSLTAGFGLLIATAGVYANTSLSVNQRLREFGIRLALGSDRSAVFALVIGEGLRTAGIGAALGIGLAAAIGQVVAALVVPVGSVKIGAAFIAMVPLLLAVGVACAAPALRATRADPSFVLRSE